MALVRMLSTSNGSASSIGYNEMKYMFERGNSRETQSLGRLPTRMRMTSLLIFRLIFGTPYLVKCGSLVS